MSIFTRIIAGEIPASIVHQDADCIAFMDIHPLARGHVLVCPTQGAVTLDELSAKQRAKLWELARRIALAQRQALGSIAQHFLVNDGPGASQTVAHVHVHVVPRYRGDRFATLARLIAHVGVLGLNLPISDRQRRRLDAHARRIRLALPLTTATAHD